jgi:hypothetical protein
MQFRWQAVFTVLEKIKCIATGTILNYKSRASLT